MSGDCKKLLLTGHIEKVRAAYSSKEGVSGITYFRLSRKKTFGNILGD